MARPHTPPAMRRRSGGSFLIGMFVGVLIGLGISLVIAFYLNKGPMPFITAKPKQAEKDATAKSRLAILGFESSVEPANLPDKGTWYRVRMGPYTRVEEINRVRQMLAQNGIDASLVKIKEPQ